MFRIWLSISKYSKVKGKRGSQILPFYHLCFIPEQKHAKPSRNQKCQKQHFKKEKATETPGSRLQKPGSGLQKHLDAWSTTNAN